MNFPTDNSIMINQVWLSVNNKSGILLNERVSGDKVWFFQKAKTNDFEYIKISAKYLKRQTCCGVPISNIKYQNIMW